MYQRKILYVKAFRQKVMALSGYCRLTIVEKLEGQTVICDWKFEKKGKHDEIVSVYLKERGNWEKQEEVSVKDGQVLFQSVYEITDFEGLALCGKDWDDIVNLYGEAFLGMPKEKEKNTPGIGNPNRLKPVQKEQESMKQYDKAGEKSAGQEITLQEMVFGENENRGETQKASLMNMEEEKKAERITEKSINTEKRQEKENDNNVYQENWKGKVQENRLDTEKRKGVEKDIEKTKGETRVEMDLFEKMKQRYGSVYPFHDDKEAIAFVPAELYKISEEIRTLEENNFLLHGFYQYRHILWIRSGKEPYVVNMIGVPGVYCRQEQSVATMFGFPEFFESGNRSLSLRGSTGHFGYYVRRFERVIS